VIVEENLHSLRESRRFLQAKGSRTIPRAARIVVQHAVAEVAVARRLRVHSMTPSVPPAGSPQLCRLCLAKIVPSIVLTASSRSELLAPRASTAAAVVAATVAQEIAMIAGKNLQHK
jgi:hypothetical protein